MTGGNTRAVTIKNGIRPISKTKQVPPTPGSPGIRHARTGPVFAPPDSYRDGFRGEGVVNAMQRFYILKSGT
jgi:hypothetical protein